MALEVGAGEWTYTQHPSWSRAAGGTSMGGVWHMPPEFDIVDYANGAPTAPDGGFSPSYRGAVPGVWWAAGYPSPSQAVLDGGFRWGFDTTNDELVVQGMVSGSWANPVLRLGDAQIGFFNTTPSDFS